MLENYSMQELQELGGREVLDANGKPVGFVDLVFVDDPTGARNGWGSGAGCRAKARG
jgi:sporulation protein YlmC with PRC-barrel domain